MTLEVAFAVAAYGRALRASIAAFRRYSDACMVHDPRVGELEAERNRLAVEADEAHQRLREVLQEGSS